MGKKPQNKQTKKYRIGKIFSHKKKLISIKTKYIQSKFSIYKCFELSSLIVTTFLVIHNIVCMVLPSKISFGFNLNS